jgi:hypothetical protein
MQKSIFKANGIAFGNPESPDYICKDYNKKVWYNTLLSESLGYLIIAINYVIRELIIKGIYWVGEKTETSKLTYITNFTFYAQFFNTGFLLLLANANFQEQPIMKKIDGGSMSDYNE